MNGYFYFSIKMGHYLFLLLIFIVALIVSIPGIAFIIAGLIKKERGVVVVGSIVLFFALILWTFYYKIS